MSHSYLYIFIFLYFYSFLNVFKVEKNSEKVLFSFAVFLVFLLTAFRMGGVFDYNAYLMFVSSAAIDVNNFLSFFTYYFEFSKIEPLSLFLIWLAGYMPSPNLVFFNFALLSSLFLYFSFRRLSLYPIFSFLLFFSHEYLYQFNGQIRSGLAFMVALFSISLFLRGRVKLSFFWCGVAVLFHFSVLILLSFYLYIRFFNRDYKLKVPVMLLCIAFVLGYSGFSVFFVSELYSILGKPHFLSRYITSDYAVRPIDITLVKLVFVSVLCFWYYRFSKLRESSYFRFFLVMIVIGISIRVLLVDYIELGSRLSSLFSLSVLFLLPYIISASRYRVFCFFIFSFLPLTQFYMNYYKLNLHGLYSTWLLGIS
jgi:hypothetical protein